MGEVYRARDTRLNRDVAVKVLPDALALDAERLARFTREAQVLGSLSHPNIAIVHGFEDVSGVHALVMELVEGATLADRIAEGRLPLDEAVPIARQIAEALEAAHEQGVIHRDLKPANIKLRPDGTIKVLDFGLAKILEPAAAGAPSSATLSPTITTPAMTQMGMILGTAAYMPPEQARGKPLDRRSDLWAFGCVLFEMLSGVRAFDGEDATDTIAAVVRGEPHWQALPADLPPAVRLLLQRCLEKDRRKRIGDAAAALFVLGEPTLLGAATPAAAVGVEPRRSSWRTAIWLALAIVAAGAIAGAAVWAITRPDPPQLSRLAITTSGASILGRSIQSQHMAVTADGSTVIYVGAGAGSAPTLFARRIDSLEAVSLAQTASAPFVRPDGEWVGFSSQGVLKRVAITGGPPVEIARSDGALRGATWGDDDTVVFATVGSLGLRRIPAGGGTPETLTKPDAARGELGHVLPRFLPGSRAVLFTITSGPDVSAAQIAVLDLRSSPAKTKILIRGGSDARYVSTGHLVYFAGDSLRAVPFDVDRLEVGKTTPVPVLDAPATVGAIVGEFEIANNGTLVYIPPGAIATDGRTLAWVDRRGREEPIPAPPRTYLYPRLSPDGTRVALDVREQENDIWVWDLVRKGFTRGHQGSRPRSDARLGRHRTSLLQLDGRRHADHLPTACRWYRYAGTCRADTVGAASLSHLLVTRRHPSRVQRFDWRRRGRGPDDAAARSSSRLRDRAFASAECRFRRATRPDLYRRNQWHGVAGRPLARLSVERIRQLGYLCAAVWRQRARRSFHRLDCRRQSAALVPRRD